MNFLRVFFVTMAFGSVSSGVASYAAARYDLRAALNPNFENLFFLTRSTPAESFWCEGEGELFYNYFITVKKEELLLRIDEYTLKPVDGIPQDVSARRRAMASIALFIPTLFPGFLFRPAEDDTSTYQDSINAIAGLLFAAHKVAAAHSRLDCRRWGHLQCVLMLSAYKEMVYFIKNEVWLLFKNGRLSEDQWTKVRDKISEICSFAARRV